MRVLTPDITHDYVELLLADGTFRIMAFDLATGCAVLNGTLSQALADGLPDTWSDPPDGYQWNDRNCGGAGEYDIVVTADPADFAVPNTPGPNTNDGTYDGSVVVGPQSNPGFLSVGATSINLAAKTFVAVNTANPTASSGNSLLKLVNGAGWSDAMTGALRLGWPVLVQQWDTTTSQPDYLRRGTHTNGQSLFVLH